jgi:hypothetical protein
LKIILVRKKTTIHVGLVLFLRVTSYSRERGRPALNVTSPRVVLFTTGIQIVMVVLFPYGVSKTLIIKLGTVRVLYYTTVCTVGIVMVISSNPKHF